MVMRAKIFLSFLTAALTLLSFIPLRGISKLAESHHALAAQRVLYVTPKGTSDGDGSRDKPLDIFTALSEKSPAKPGDTIMLTGGVYEGKMSGIARVPFELGVSGTAANPVRIIAAPGESAHLNGTTTVTSSYAQYIDLDIGDLKWEPSLKLHHTGAALDVRGGTGTRIINCNIFGGALGTATWSGAVDFEIYGSLIHDFGSVEETGRGHGHAWYAQNKEGTKVFANNIAYRGFGWNVHIYTAEGDINGFDIIGNICYIAGGLKPDQTVDNYLISGYRPADRIRMIRNVGYQPANIDKWRPNARLSSYGEASNGTALFKDNYLMGAPVGLLIGLWNNLTVEGNTVWAFDTLVDITAAAENSRNYRIDKNTYITNGAREPFKVRNASLSFEKWQALGFDKGGTLVQQQSGRPLGSRVFIFDNKYQKGRANIGVFNWDSKDEVSVDLSPVVSKGQKIRIYNCLDVKQTLSMAKPILELTYTGSAISIPMRRDKISPHFESFLVVPFS